MTWRCGPPKNNTFPCLVEEGHYTFLYYFLLRRLIDCYRRRLFRGLSLYALFIRGKHPHFVIGCSVGSETWMIKNTKKSSHRYWFGWLVLRMNSWTSRKSFNHYLRLNMSKWKFYMCLVCICVSSPRFERTPIIILTYMYISNYVEELCSRWLSSFIASLIPKVLVEVTPLLLNL